MKKANLNLLFALALAIFLPSCYSSNNDGGGVTGTGTGFLVIEPYNGDSSPSNPDNQESCEPVNPTYGYFEDEPTSNTKLTPPSWLTGNWVGSRSNGDSISVVFVSDDVFFGDLEQQRRISQFYLGEVLEELKSEQIYEFSVEAESFIGDEFEVRTVYFKQTYENIGDNSALYTLDSPDFTKESLQLAKRNAGSFLQPPAWLQGQWDSLCSMRTITQNNIQIGFKGSDQLVDYFSILDSPSSTLSVISFSDYRYEIKGTYLPPNESTRVQFSELFKRNSDETVTRESSEFNAEISSFFRERLTRLQ